MRDFSNVVSLSYAVTESFFKLSELHKQCFALMRVGDFDDANTLIISVSGSLQKMLLNLDETINKQDDRELTLAFKKAFTKGKQWCIKRGKKAMSH